MGTIVPRLRSIKHSETLEVLKLKYPGLAWATYRELACMRLKYMVATSAYSAEMAENQAYRDISVQIAREYQGLLKSNGIEMAVHIQPEGIRLSGKQCDNMTWMSAAELRSYVCRRTDCTFHTFNHLWFTNGSAYACPMCCYLHAPFKGSWPTVIPAQFVMYFYSPEGDVLCFLAEWPTGTEEDFIEKKMEQFLSNSALVPEIVRIKIADFPKQKLGTEFFELLSMAPVPVTWEEYTLPKENQWRLDTYTNPKYNGISSAMVSASHPTGKIKGAFWKDNKYSTLGNFNAETDVFRDWDLYCALRANMSIAISEGKQEEFFAPLPQPKKLRT